ncbi:MAG: protein-methionine-sulfoxide reductase catalytic subunit MsrP, partial [Planctomycetota bacterium]|nr:protein-methionine-sulfoxide reductase catalytic subunit MsrP [Planctomycetota bacterium]
MPSIHLKEGWEISENAVTPEDVFMNRRKVIKTGLGIAGAGTIGGLTWNHLNAEKHVYDTSRYKKMKFVKNENFRVKRAMTDEAVAGNYNNFYEFSEQKGQVITLARNMKTRPWKVEVGGLVS